MSALQPFHEALREASIGAVLADFDGRVLFANQTICSRLGFSEDEMRAKSWTELSPPEDTETQQALLDQLRAGSTHHFHFDKRCLRRDGSLFVAHWSVWSLGNRGVPFVLAMITDQEQADAARRESEEHFRDLADNVPVMIWTSGLDGASTYNNRRWLEFTGCSRAETKGKGWADAIHPDDQQRAMRTYERAFELREPFQREYRLRRRDGEYRWVLGSGVPRFGPDGSFAGYVGSVIDISELKHAMATLRESEERFRLVANTAPVMIWMSGPDGGGTYLNQTWLEFTGRSLDQELGMGWAQGIHPDDRERCAEIYTHAFDRREPYRIEHRLRRYDGEYRWILTHSAPRFNADGSFAGYIGSSVDVTERKQAEEALSLVSRKLIEAQDQERTRIARELHDDINQRLALVAVNLDGLKHHPPASTKVLLQKLGTVKEEIDNLSTDVQALSHRLHSPKLQFLGLAGAAGSFCREFSNRQGVEIDFQAEDIPKELPPETSLCLFRVLQEALQNAAKHSGSRHFGVRLSHAANEIELTVHDAGVGFNPEEAISAPGIGLTSMKERIKLVDGDLSIESRPNGGTTIRARVPITTRTKSARSGV